MDVWGLFVWQHLPLSPTVIPAFTRAQHRKKSSSCLIHLLLDTHKIQLKPNNNAPPIPRPPSAAIQVSCWGSGLVDFLNPPLPAWGLGKKREQNQWSAIVQAHSLLAFPPFFLPFLFFPSIHLAILSLPLMLIRSQGAATYPSYDRAKGKVHPGQAVNVTPG